MEVRLWCIILVRDNSSLFMLYTSRTSVRLCYNYWNVNVMCLINLHLRLVHLFQTGNFSHSSFLVLCSQKVSKEFFSGLLMFCKLSSYSPCSIKITIYFYGLELNKNGWASLLFLVHLCFSELLEFSCLISCSDMQPLTFIFLSRVGFW